MEVGGHINGGLCSLGGHSVAGQQQVCMLGSSPPHPPTPLQPTNSHSGKEFVQEGARQLLRPLRRRVQIKDRVLLLCEEGGVGGWWQVGGRGSPPIQRCFLDSKQVPARPGAETSCKQHCTSSQAVLTSMSATSSFLPGRGGLSICRLVRRMGQRWRGGGLRWLGRNWRKPLMQQLALTKSAAPFYGHNAATLSASSQPAAHLNFARLDAPPQLLLHLGPVCQLSHFCHAFLLQ